MSTRLRRTANPRAAVVYRAGTPRRASVARVFFHAPLSRDHVGEQVCPTCGFIVPVRRSNGKLASHRVGSTQRDAWSCQADRETIA